MRRLLLLLGVTVLVAAAGCQAVADGLPGRSPCEGVESTMCARLVAEMAADRTRTISAIRIRCEAGTCDQGDGEVRISVSFADGTTDVRTVVWDGSALPIGFPAMPTCQAIGVDPCLRQAANSWRLGDEGSIVRIHVRCDEERCGPDEGAGTTRVTLRDGTVREESWAHAMAPEPAPIQP